MFKGYDALRNFVVLQKLIALVIGSYSICCFVLALQVGESTSPGEALTPAKFESGQIHRVRFESQGSRSFETLLHTSEFLELMATPHHLQVQLRFLNPQGQEPASSACVSINGVSHCAIAASESGNYRLQVEASSIEADVASSCEILIVARRPSTSQDEALVQAIRLARQGDEASRRKGEAQLGEAIRLLEASLALFQETTNEGGRARVLSMLANLYLRQGERQRAQQILQQTLDLSRENRDPYTEAAALYMQARMQAAVGENEEAVEHYRQVARLRESLADSFGRALALHNLAAALWAIGENREALQRYDEALQIRERLQDRTGIAYTLYGIAIVHWTMGSDQDALDTYQRALRLWRELGDARGEANTLNSIGLIYSGLQDRARALRYFDQSLSLWESLKNRSGEAYTRNNLGMVYAAQGEFQRARDSYLAALRLLEPLEDARGQAYVQHNLGSLLLSSGETEEALDHLRLSLQLKEKLADPFGSARTMDRLAEAFLEQGDSARAIQLYQQALALQRQVGDRNGEVISLGGLARTEENLGRLKEALDLIRTATQLIETLRLNFRSDELRTSFFANWHDYYAFQIEILMKLDSRFPGQGFDRKALEVSEQARSRTLLEALSQAEVKVDDSDEPRLAGQERALRLQIERKVEVLDRLKSAGFSAKQREKVERELDQILEQYRETREELRRKSPHHFSLLAGQPFNVDELQRDLIGGEDLFLEFFLGKDRSFLWAITPDSLQAFELPPKAEINSSASRLYELLTTRNRLDHSRLSKAARERVEEADTKLRTEAQALSRILLGSLPPQLRRRRLILVSDGFLHYVPFAALAEPENWRQEQREGRSIDPDYLGLQHEIVGLPSLAVLWELRRQTQARTPASELLALFADPVFGSDDPRLLASGNSESSNDGSSMETNSDRQKDLKSSPFLRLRFSRFEAEEIAKLVPSSQRLLALDFAASRKTLEETDPSRFRFLHFATHTVVDDQHPELSGIVLSEVDQQGKPQDGVIRLYEIYDFDLKADLVVLSACQTALGKQIAGEGLIGLARGFLYAGASSVLASLWKVEDRATAVFMRKFYSAMLIEKKSRQQALQSAQKAMLQDRRWQSPYYWAAFVMQGNWL